MSYERITDDPVFDGAIRDNHESRYKIASGFIERNNIVVDFGCGIGYGENILCKDGMNTSYIGLDKSIVKETHWEVDLQDAEGMKFAVPSYYDVAVCFEVIEHLSKITILVNSLKKANSYIILSTPIIPTKHRNEFHVRDFTPDDIITLFKDEEWGLYQWFKQQAADGTDEVYGLFIFKRIKNG